MVEELEKHGLYGGPSVQRYLREIEKVKSSKEAPYSYTDFEFFDSLNYGGNSKFREYLTRIQLTQGALALDLGSGIGSTARLASCIFGLDVVAVDYLPPFADINHSINALCGIHNIKSLAGDASTLDLAAHQIEGKCDLVYSLQVFLYIPDKQSLFRNLFNAVKPGGAFYIEDHLRENKLELTHEEAKIFSEFQMQEPTTIEEYVGLLEGAGLTVEHTQNLGVDFARHTFTRANDWVLNKERILKESGQEYWDTRVAQGIQACCLYHNLGLSLAEARAEYPALVSYLDEGTFERWVESPAKFTGVVVSGRRLS